MRLEHYAVLAALALALLGVLIYYTLRPRKPHPNNPKSLTPVPDDHPTLVAPAHYHRSMVNAYPGSVLGGAAAGMANAHHMRRRTDPPPRAPQQRITEHRPDTYSRRTVHDDYPVPAPDYNAFAFQHLMPAHMPPAPERCEAPAPSCGSTFD